MTQSSARPSLPLLLRSVDPPKQCGACLLHDLPDLFLPASPEERAAIAAWRSGTREVRAGGSIIDERERSTHLYTLYSGWAFRYKTLSDGRRQILHFLLPGDLMGLQDEFAEGRTYGVDAATDVRLCAFPRDKLWAFFHAQPNMGYAISWLAAREEKMMDDALVTNGRRNAAERVAMLLMHLFRRAEHLGMTEGRRLAFPFNQQHIADALGLSLVHTNKTLRRLQREGLHRLEGGVLEILNPHALEQLGDYFERPVRPVPVL
ncbi:Crp/Fnr family transcriptional regulator [Xenophilus sp. Marseille-Q4582]|uniref:Crp/Fnr family transcriptional regulator n=1 Tax=Xenophilus sp. Marseille-Q4582 TaxID=2866600 RepID=UPI001CE3DC40|nr:Crp/Fnr family transcriptional regulator [Xenophilus sp. Marseille-Q4582]